jgi:hypothetical protein
MSDLRELAERTRNSHKAKTNEEVVVEETTEIEDDVVANEIEDESSVVVDDDDDDAVVVMGDDDDDDTTSDIIEELDDDDLNSGVFELTDEDLRAEMPELDEENFMMASGRIKDDVIAYRKKLIIEEGFTADEATRAAIQRMKKLGREENEHYLEENPKLGVVEVNKQDASKLEFTKEEREKLSKVKAIKLKVIEDVELRNIEVERVDKKHKASVLQSIDTNLSQYSVPLPLLNDYCRFKGSQIIQLIQAVRYDDATLDEIIAKKASLVYNQLSNSANLKKYDDKGKTIMSYQDFINKFLFHDLDMGLYGILVASSMESIDSSLTCGSCNESFQWTYNLKSLLNLDDLTDEFKDKFEDILSHKTDEEYLVNLYNENHKSIRVKSPLTNNIFELNYPTVARAINLYKLIDAKDETMLYLSAFAMFISKVYVYNTKTQTYVEIEEDEYRILFDMLQAIPQEEINMIQEFLKPFLYSPKFILKSVCPSCGHKMTNELSIDDLVFLKARDSSMEIQQ